MDYTDYARCYNCKLYLSDIKRCKRKTTTLNSTARADDVEPFGSCISFDEGTKLTVEQYQKELILKQKAKRIDFDVKELQEKIYELIAVFKNKRRATEVLSNYFLEREKIYTTREDEKSEMWIYREGIYLPQAKTYIKEFCREVLKEAYTSHFYKEVIDKIEAETFIEQDIFFNISNKEEIAVENGILNVINSNISNFTPEKRFFNKLPVIYDVNKNCDNIINFFNSVLNDKNDVKIVQELFGYCLYKEYTIEKAFMFHGDGRNGKGKTIEILKRFLGVDNCTNIPLQQLEKDKFSKSDLFNKLANLSPDISSEALENTGEFKSLTGRDLQSADRKFKTRIKFTNYAKMIFCANELPITKDVNIAFWNRWILVDFPYTFLSQKELDVLTDKKKNKNYKLADPTILDKLITDNQMSGLLNWSLEGLNRLFDKNDFSSSKTNEDIRITWLRNSDSLQAFIMDEITIDIEKRISKANFRRIYVKYCRKHGLSVCGDKHIKDIILKMGADDARRKDLNEEQIPVWDGLAFKKGGVDLKGFSVIDY